MLDDKYITKEGFLVPEGYQGKPTYKVVSYHYFRLRLLQSEILQVLQHRQAQQARAIGANQGNEYMHTKLPSPFLVNFDSFRSWRLDIDRRLLEWRESSPSQQDAGVQFSPLFLELNYWQAVIMLYRQSLAVPAGLANELGNTDGNVGSPSVVDAEEREDEEHVFLKVAEAGQKVLKLYRYVQKRLLYECDHYPNPGPQDFQASWILRLSFSKRDQRCMQRCCALELRQTVSLSLSCSLWHDSSSRR